VAMLLRKPLAVHRATGRINVRRRPVQAHIAQATWQPAPMRQSQAGGSPAFAHAERCVSPPIGSAHI
jgi:hypothetical protein